MTAAITLAALIALAPPPFGTVAQSWNLAMSSSYAGAGITWCRSAGRFLLMDQSAPMVWELDPADPTGTLSAVNWVMTDVGTNGTDIPWGIVWDPDSNCLWISQIDASIYSGCWLMRYNWNDSSWTWGGTPADSWQVGDTMNGGALHMFWLAGIEKRRDRGVFYGAPVAGTPTDSNHVCRFDPYTKTNLGRLPHGSVSSERGCALVPWDSAYVLTCGANTDRFIKRDSTGLELQFAAAPPMPSDWAVMVPRDIVPTDTVWAFCIHSSANNTLSKVSLGMTWAQLNIGVQEPGAEPRPVVMAATVTQGPLRLDGSTKAELLDGLGRRVALLRPGTTDIGHLPAGVYFVGGGEDRVSRKVLLQH